jgi:hypothetical protein
MERDVTHTDRTHHGERGVLLGFYIHLAAFVAVMALLLVINALHGGPWWVRWPLLGWGTGLLAHGIATFYIVRSIRGRRHAH